MRKLFAVVLLLSCWIAFPALTYASHSHSSSSHSSKSKKSKGSDSTKTVHVKGYYRKDGTYVAPHDRRPPGTAEAGSSTTYRRNYVADGYAAHSTVQRDKNGKIKRSKSARDAFMRQQPCPWTGRTSGSCPGYVVEHVNPLECGGADAPTNMQWQTTADAKAKDKAEGSCRL
jgi:hypothetical protein